VLSSPAGIALTTPDSTHIHTEEDTAISAGRHVSVSAGRSFLVSALDKVSIFAHKLGMRLFAAKGKVEIQAQSDDLDIIAEKVVTLISAKGDIRISAPKEICLSAGGSYLRINENGIEQGTNGQWTVHSQKKIMSGPDSKQWLIHHWKRDDLSLGGQVAVYDESGRHLNLECYAKQLYRLIYFSHLTMEQMPIRKT
jgi:type VI secretion system secreted protein VgrG